MIEPMMMPAMAPPLRLDPEEELSLRKMAVDWRAWRKRAMALGMVLVGGGIFDAYCALAEYVRISIMGAVCKLGN